MHHRRFDFCVSAAVEIAPQLGNHLCALAEDFLHFLVRDQVEVALAIAHLDVGQAVPFFRQRQQRLGQKRELLDPDGQLIRPGPEQMPGDSDEVPHVQQLKQLKRLFSDHVELDVDLDALACSLKVRKTGFAMQAQRNDASGDPRLDPLRLQLFFCLFSVPLHEPGWRRGPMKLMWVGVVAKGANLFEFFLTLLELVERLKFQGRVLSRMAVRQYSDGFPAASITVSRLLRRNQI